MEELLNKILLDKTEAALVLMAQYQSGQYAALEKCIDNIKAVRERLSHPTPADLQQYDLFAEAGDVPARGDKDVTELVCFNENDGEGLPILKCVCGQEFAPWYFVVGIYRHTPKVCPDCGRRLYFRNSIRVYEVC
jgi:hypothetical protein